MLWFFLACHSSPAPPSTAVEPPCDAITGAHGLAVVSLDDPTQLLEAPEDDDSGGVLSLAGPDADGVVTLATHAGALLRSSDGCTWEEGAQLPDALATFVFDTGGRPEQRHVVGELLVDPRSTSLFVHHDGLLLVSHDAGATFETVADDARPTALVVHPTTPDRWRLAGELGGEHGVFETSDAGLSWSLVVAPPPTESNRIPRLYPHPDDWGTVAVVGTEVTISTDDGASWTTAAVDGDPVGFAFDPDGLSVWARDAGQPVVLRSTDGGVTFDAVPVGAGSDARLEAFGRSGDSWVAAGLTLPEGPWLEVTTPTSTHVHDLSALGIGFRGVALLDDRAVVAFDDTTYWGP